MNLKIIKTDLLDPYLVKVPSELPELFGALVDAEISTGDFSFYTSVASVFSSKIEGENIELDSYIKYKRFGIEFLPDYTKKIDDLYDTYTFARTNILNELNIKLAHQILGKHILAKQYQGKFRTNNMYVTTQDGRIEYIAASPYEVDTEMQKLYYDIDVLLNAPMSISEVFFFASMIHLVFVKIHPWNDGNGRSARLIEKWFLAQKLGEKAWFVQSEKKYYQEHQTYYRNIRAIDLEYAELDYLKALPFLLMLPDTLIDSMGAGVQ